ncbi:MAG TPA: dihydroneopterin aldolase [Candidatus Omnitrophota bacterium]|nr:dihydroneopterin aldolase [Candidatus Omnitrophota bacterium]HPD85357.1 dihydroneopterin aldolase [Candidatus Omnitrophota bacterium]HRZ04142.1 dihydroneopterin aldolase [Candidatus Omnitrophota bacterium]
MAAIRITDLSLYIVVGTNAWERTRKQKVVINVTFEYNALKAIRNDDIKNAVDYKALTKKIIKEASASHFFLLESLADFILKIIMEDRKIKRATVRADKPKALRFAKSVSVELSAHR